MTLFHFLPFYICLLTALADTIRTSEPIAIVDITVKPCSSCLPQTSTAIALTVYDAEDLRKSVLEWRRKRSKQQQAKLSESEFSVKAVEDQWLVIFDGYFSQEHRHNVILTALSGEHVEIVPRNNPAAVFESDFDVLLWPHDERKKLESLLDEHEDIKEVKQQKQISRKLQYIKSQDIYLPSEARVHRAGQRKPQSVSSSDYWFGSEKLRSRKLMRSVVKPVTDELQADILWDLGFTGAGIKVAIFDTGLPKNHPHFRNVKDRTNWTNEKSLDDGLGHGTFVAGLIASSAECLGFAPNADVHVYRVFTNQQVSYTSWFLDAFNYAILSKIDVLNLSIGGPDFMDTPFVDKVWEMSANGIIMISAIGNDGPLYGTLNNPADQMDVIGVGGTDFAHNIAKFSSRGMTTWELPAGYGRVKPDIVTYGSSVRGSGIYSGCRTLSGTSVASPVVAGVVTLLYSTVPEEKRRFINPASMKQALMHGAKRIDGTNMFEQGAGRIDLIQSWKILKAYKPQATLSPPYIDFMDCPYMWPYCSQSVFHTGMPTIANVTILNAISVSSKIVGTPIWRPYDQETGHFVDISVSHSSVIWPWTGYIALTIMINEKGAEFEGIISGHLEFSIHSKNNDNKEDNEDDVEISEMKLPLRISVIPRPKRWQRVLWDQFHNLRYPPGYFPRDNLKMKNDPLDWNGDHIHTNFRDLYERLRAAGYFIDVLGESFNCFDASNYGTLMIVDSEEEFFAEEIEKITLDVENGLNLIVFGDWFNTEVMKKVRFFDENTRQWWIPDTGGANVPALNELLEPFEIGFGDIVSDGEFEFSERQMNFASGSSIVQFPDQGQVLVRNLRDQGADILRDEKDENFKPKENPVAIFGVHEYKLGKVAVYGDSNCIDGAHMQKECYWLVEELLQYFRTKLFAQELASDLVEWSAVKEQFESFSTLPERFVGNQLHRFSKVLVPGLSMKKKPIPECKELSFLTPQYLNDSKSTLSWKNRPLLSIDWEEENLEIQSYKPLPSSRPETLSFATVFIVFSACGAALLFLVAQLRSRKTERNQKPLKFSKSRSNKNLST